MSRYLSAEEDFLSLLPHAISISDMTYAPYVSELRGINTPDSEPILLKILQMHAMPISSDTSHIEIFKSNSTALEQYEKYFAKPTLKLKLNVKRPNEESKNTDMKKKIKIKNI
jgi:hypothetical protein